MGNTGNIERITSLAGGGYRFFPCYKTKSPATTHGFYDSTSDIEKLKSMFNENEDFLIGFPCGELNKNIVVIDVDINKAGDIRTIDELLTELEDIVGEIPRNGFQVQTQSGGLHLYFKAPEGVKFIGGTRFFHKTLPIDLQSTGKYVIFPDNKNYFVYDSDIEIDDFYNHLPTLPDNIINFKKQSTESIDSQPENVLPESEILEIRSALSFLSSDDRDSWIKVGLALKSTGSSSAYGLWNEWSKTSDKYNPNDMEKRWKTLDPNDITIASLFFEAKKYGWHTTYEKTSTQLPTLPSKEKQKEFKKKLFPEELLRPEGLVGDIIDYIMEKSIMHQPIFALSASLCAVGALAGRKIQTDTGTRTNIYCLNVGESGCGKEAPRKAIKDIFVAAGCSEKASVEDLASDAAIITEMNNSLSQIFLIDEVGHFLKAINKKNSGSHLTKIIEILLKLYGNANQVVNGKSYADKDKKITLIQPNLCLLGTTVPEVLYKGLNYDNATDGFLARMLIFETDDNMPRKQRGKNLLAEPKKYLIDKVKALNKKPIKLHPEGNLDHINVPDPQVVQKNENALDILYDFEDYIYDLRKELKVQNRISSPYNRITQLAEQIALIVAVGKNIDEPVITENEMSYGIGLAKYLSDHMQFVIENYMARNDREHEVKRILNIIRNAGLISLEKISLHSQNLHGSERNDILSTLTDSGQIRDSLVGTGIHARKMYTAL